MCDLEFSLKLIYSTTTHSFEFIDFFLLLIIRQIVNVTLLWSILLLTDYSTFSWCQFTVYVSIPLLVISSEIILGTVRVQDYYKAKLVQIPLSFLYAIITIVHHSYWNISIIIITITVVQYYLALQ